MTVIATNIILVIFRILGANLYHIVGNKGYNDLTCREHIAVNFDNSDRLDDTERDILKGGYMKYIIVLFMAFVFMASGTYAGDEVTVSDIEELSTFYSDTELMLTVPECVRYSFHPQRDITAYELANILKLYHGDVPTELNLLSESDREAVMRHLVDECKRTESK